jgi:uncharacterized protein YjbI with pentapeptide repeats
MLKHWSHHNLRNRSFRHQDLRGADFVGADISGTDFTDALLTNANFSQAKAGLSKLLILRFLFFTVLLAFLSGFIAAYAGAVLGNLFTATSLSQLSIGCFVLTGLILFGIISIRNGFTNQLGIISLVTATSIVSIVAITPNPEIASRAAVSSLAFGGAIAGLVSLSTAISSSRKSRSCISIAILGIIAGTLFGIPMENHGVFDFIGVAIVSLSTLILANYIAQRANHNDRRYQLIRTLAISLSTSGGTRFNNADLTDANFTDAQLSGSDLRGAKLTRTNWHHANLDRANLDRTYLENPQIRQLLTSGDGRGQDFDRLDLRGVNLQSANLIEASLIGTDLTEANLQNADLSRAKLVQTQLYSTNLSGACLTGAFIQNWGIAPDTKFDGVKCDYIHMHLPTTADPDPCRKPDNRQQTFQDGDFTDFIAPIIRTLDSYQQQNLDPRTLTIVPKTLDLYHHDGIDPSAAAVALQQLIEQHPEAQIQVKAIEGRGNQKVRLQAQVADEVDRSQLNTDYFANYNQLKALAYPDLQRLLAGVEEKDARIRSLESIIMTAVSSNKFYVETYQSNGEFIVSQSKGNVNISDVKGNISGIAAAGENQSMTGVAIGAISGAVTNTISQLPDSSNSAEPGIKELLIQLQTAIEAEAELAEEDKVEALEQLQVLAEAGQKPQDNAMQKAAKTAMKVLKGTVSSLPEAAKLADACAKLLPIISGILLF